jgi:UDP-N-acetylglucosamine diphosphorylase / glucose-1-phosphate thymidylyltransferase / UDP-N-acetylgalactosamine diphosphorylase / glucosamine-1-phosphate N-acetyltransferase / galactosamine-1-phosphate N-acetyltransferase
MDLNTYLQNFRSEFDDQAKQLPWHIIKNIESILRDKITGLSKEFNIKDDVAIHSSAKLEHGCIIKGPAIISAGCFIAAHAYLRGGVFLGEKVIVGPGTEIKSSIILSGTALAHFNFVGDSLVGSQVNMEAGSVIANHFNERTDKTIYVHLDGKRMAIDSQKFGALVGDHTRIGANAVLSPGTILSSSSIVKRLELVEQA